MEPLFRQLRQLRAQFDAQPRGLRALLLAGLVLAVLFAILYTALGRRGTGFEYAFTNLTPEDAGEAAAILKANNVLHHVDANGTAISVPPEKVYDVRILLATAGLPRGGGVGFELFDRSDLGVSEFTQKVQLRRAIEGELARTIGRLAGVKSARVTVSLGERGLYRDEDKKPSATVVVNLHANRSLVERELTGIRHLVSSAVPGLSPTAVTVIDGRGAVLSADPTWDAPEAVYQRKVEWELEQRILGLLEPVVGSGAVFAKVTAAFDHSKVSSNAELYDPDGTALRSERRQAKNEASQSQQPAGVTGAAANLPLQPVAPQNTPQSTSTESANDEVRNFEVSKTVTNTASALPRLQRLSIAVVVDGVGGKPRPAPDVARLGELARKAVGFDEARGDQFEITSELFERPPPPEARPEEPIAWWVWVLVTALAAALFAVAFFAVRSRRARAAAAAAAAAPQLVLEPGATVSDLEARAAALAAAAQAAGLPTDTIPAAVAAGLAQAAGLPAGAGIAGLAGLAGLPPGAAPPPGAVALGPDGKEAKGPSVVDPLAELREHARALVRHDRERAVLLMRAWLASDLEKLQGDYRHG